MLGLEAFIIESNWILKLRGDFFTDLFKIFPFFASGYFYITCIALGYWLRPANPLFISLGFLVPFSTLLNCLLKNLFRIPRPDISLHLVSVYDPFGFPSGDVQVAAVFWTALFISLRTNLFRYLCLLSIVGIGISRVYLGVHSIYDVLGGVIFGLATLYIHEKYLDRQIKGQNGYKKIFLIIIITAGLYCLTLQGLRPPPMIPIAIGALIGFAISLPRIQYAADSPALQKMSLIAALISLVIIIATVKITPSFQGDILLAYTLLILKYCLTVYGIFVLLPKFMSKFFKPDI